MNSSLIEKIKKLLALAQSNVPAERDAALAKAYSLAAENQIDLALIDPNSIGRVQEEQMLKGEVALKKAFDLRHRYVAAVLGTFFEVYIVRNKSAVFFIGKTSDVEFARYLFDFLVDEFTRRWNYYRKTDAALQHLDASQCNRFKSTFYYGVFDGLSEKLKAEKAALEARKFAEIAASRGLTSGQVSQQYGLVLVGNQEKRLVAAKAHFPHLRTSTARPVQLRSQGALEAGRSAGRSINTSRPLSGGVGRHALV